MNELLNNIDELVTHIKNDSTRKKLPDLMIQLVALSKIYGEAKQDMVRAKNKYDREFVMKKEQRRQELERLENDRYTRELSDNPKAKKNKITNVDIESNTELDLMKVKREQEAPTLIVVYLEPIIKSYYELVNSWKFIDRETIKAEKTYNEAPF